MILPVIVVFEEHAFYAVRNVRVGSGPEIEVRRAGFPVERVVEKPRKKVVRGEHVEKHIPERALLQHDIEHDPLVTHHGELVDGPVREYADVPGDHLLRLAALEAVDGLPLDDADDLEVIVRVHKDRRVAGVLPDGDVCIFRKDRPVLRKTSRRREDVRHDKSVPLKLFPVEAFQILPVDFPAGRLFLGELLVEQLRRLKSVHQRLKISFHLVPPRILSGLPGHFQPCRPCIPPTRAGKARATASRETAHRAAR